jgi:putative ABC transport system substrate-binding protein
LGLTGRSTGRAGAGLFLLTGEYADTEGLFGYGANFLALYRRAPVFVDKILKGTKPADIPIERPTAFEFVINMKTAAALRVAVSSVTRLRADRIIE